MAERVETFSDGFGEADKDIDYWPWRRLQRITGGDSTVYDPMAIRGGFAQTGTGTGMATVSVVGDSPSQSQYAAVTPRRFPGTTIPYQLLAIGVRCTGIEPPEGSSQIVQGYALAMYATTRPDTDYDTAVIRAEGTDEQVVVNLGVLGDTRLNVEMSVECLLDSDGGAELIVYMGDDEIGRGTDPDVLSGDLTLMGGISSGTVTGRMNDFRCGQLIDGDNANIDDVNGNNIILSAAPINVNGSNLGTTTSASIENNGYSAVLQVDHVGNDLVSLFPFDLHNSTVGLGENMVLTLHSPEGEASHFVEWRPAAGMQYVTLIDQPYSLPQQQLVDPVELFSDSFEYDDGPLDADGWDTVPGTNPIDIVNSTATVVSGGLSRDCGSVLSSHQPIETWSEFTLAAAPSGPIGWIGVLTRGNLATVSYFAMIIRQDTVAIAYSPPGSGFEIIAEEAHTPDVGGVYRFEAIGDELTGYLDGGQLIQVTDNRRGSGASGLVGLSGTSDGSSGAIDNYRFGTWSTDGQDGKYMAEGIEGVVNGDLLECQVALGNSAISLLDDADAIYDPAVPDGSTHDRWHYSQQRGAWDSGQVVINGDPDIPPEPKPPRWTGTPNPPAATEGNPYEYVIGYMLEGDRPMTLTDAGTPLPNGLSYDDSEYPEKIVGTIPGGVGGSETAGIITRATNATNDSAEFALMVEDKDCGK